MTGRPTAPARRPVPTSAAARLTLSLGDVPYDVRPIPRGWWLRKAGGAAYRVTRDDDDMPQCDCPDSVHRRTGGVDYCKHIHALTSLGMLPWPNATS